MREKWVQLIQANMQLDAATGRYRAQYRVYITTESATFEVWNEEGPILDLSNDHFLVVRNRNRDTYVDWNKLTGISFLSL
jgi:hypothetical protein